MTESVEALERRIGQLRASVREAVLAGERARARQLRADLRAAEGEWEQALTDASPQAIASGTEPEPGQRASLLPLREQVHEALTLLQVPAAPRLIATVREAFFTSGFPAQRVTSMRRDEERSFRASPFARPYYICAALSAERLSPSRGLLAVSTWPLEKRVIGSLSPRVDFLEGAIRVAEAVERIPGPAPAGRRLLARFAASIPGASIPGTGADPATVKAAAEAELGVHGDEDGETRREAARRVRAQLDDAGQLFGATLSPATGKTGTRKGTARGA